MTEVRNINDIEGDLIKQTFSDNEELLKSIRGLMLGLEITTEEKAKIKATFQNKELLKIMWKRFYPTLDKNTPIGQVQDVWMGAEDMIFGRAKDTIQQAVEYKDKALKMTKKALSLLADVDGEKLDLTFELKDNLMDEMQSNLLARNQFIRHVETQLNFLWLIAQQKEKSAGEIEKTKKLNSTK